MDFKKFLKLMRNTPLYNTLMEEKEKEKMPISSNEFFAIFLINDLLEKGYKMFMIIPLFENKYHQLIKDVIRNKFKPDKLVVGWSRVHNALSDIDIHNSYINDDEYFKLYYPRKLT